MYRDSTTPLAHRDSKYCAIPACNRDCSLPTNGTLGRIAALVTQTTTTAVPLAGIPPTVFGPLNSYANEPNYGHNNSANFTK
jgi:hypothetical protein